MNLRSLILNSSLLVISDEHYDGSFPFKALTPSETTKTINGKKETFHWAGIKEEKTDKTLLYLRLSSHIDHSNYVVYENAYKTILEPMLHSLYGAMTSDFSITFIPSNIPFGKYSLDGRV